MSSVSDHSPDPERHPSISMCLPSPEKSVFFETGNTNGWIATDTTVDVEP